MTAFRSTFSALRVPNYRLFIAGQIVSVSGTWMQKIAQSWLILELTGSGTALGVTAALQHLPMLLAGAWGGLIADRLDKRKVLIWTQLVAGALAFLLATLTVTGLIQVWMVMVLAFVLGTVNALDKPVRHTFVSEMVGREHLTNAITLNTVVMRTGMLVGPAIAGVLIARIGIAPSFFVNGVSFGAVVLGLLLMRADQLQRTEPVPRAKGQLRAGLRYAVQTPVLAGPLVLITVASVLAFEWAVTLPMLAVDAFSGDASTLGTMYSFMGLGAVLGGLVVAGSLKGTSRTMIIAGFVFATMLAILAVAPTLPVALVVLVFVGGSTIALQTVAHSVVQLASVPEMRGRVVSLLTVGMLGTRPIGAPLVGWIGETFGSRVAVGVGAVGAATATTIVLVFLRGHGLITSRVVRDTATREQDPAPVA